MKIYRILGATIVIFALILMLFFIKNSDNYFNNYLCQRLLEFRKIEFKGLIISHYKDSNNHNSPIIHILGNKKELIVDLSNEKSNLFSKLEIKDSIIKNIGSLKYTIKKGGRIIIDSVQFNCK